mmetsp:Transcript_12520/g.14340  ORF Transcript_12520/g.14340 Transcript_12520/m.14340 type:complete len:91 (+) Transcript_12520:149-421(+)
MAKKLHPDALNREADELPEYQNELFKLATEAYYVLSNEDRRREYDSLILGRDPQKAEQKFYDPTKKRSENEDKEFESRDQFNRNVAEKLK